jgi:Uma2 family endonuclease
MRLSLSTKLPGRPPVEDMISRPLRELLDQLIFAQAAELAARGDYTEAERLLKEEISAARRRPDVLDLLARIAAQQGKYSQAVDLWRQAARLAPEYRERCEAGLTRIAILLNKQQERQKQAKLSKSSTRKFTTPFVQGKRNGKEEQSKPQVEEAPQQGNDSGVGAIHDNVLCRLVLLLGNYVHQQHLGIVTLSRTGYRLASGDAEEVCTPDLAFVSAGRVPQAESSWEQPWELAPDLVVEIALPTQSQEEMNQRARRWVKSGVQLVWVIWTATKMADVWVAGSEEPSLEKYLEGPAEVLPGFVCPVASIF